ncbi:uncharacterized protein TRIVIDRAFT_227214 [Trichoderma virens Gv29-8]|uniref:Uncharacterized protein n=1 Tax=Hypocrea virens (strain Gv29-8 / FGSC 10586) TaxID=413071 RepID=G9N8R9_HYPVG|nr:uncharacterized protein TRIVIDRAFT_227214 [Trichoderma virens Gv29-8]EHK17374.1 hypothetical protein TRIVIDRAFT_227214 [Trichoderma virens Gv29-8]UKZ55792.1 hypothetical protein TrVGV298_009616 [Trichoderma virens]
MATTAETTATVPRLEIADLGLNEDDINFSDGVACVTTYWAYAMTMTVADRHSFCQKVRDKKAWAHSNTSRGQPSGHRIYRSALGKSVVGYLFLMALLASVTRRE